MDHEEIFRTALVDLVGSVLDIAAEMQKAKPDDHHAEMLLDAVNKAVNEIYRTVPPEVLSQLKDE